MLGFFHSLEFLHKQSSLEITDLQSHWKELFERILGLYELHHILKGNLKNALHEIPEELILINPSILACFALVLS